MNKMPKMNLFLVVGMLGMGLISNLAASEQKTEELIPPEEAISGFLTVEENSLLPSSSLPEPKVVKKIKVVVTAYSSTVFETDDSPFITAAGTTVRDGIVANNLLPFGTKVRLPELYGDKVFVVEDRMNWKKGSYHFDIWFSSHQAAENFGAKITYIEVLES